MEEQTTQPTVNRGALYGALAKAQAEFPPIPRTRTVTVRSEKGNYTFDYAPLDTILSVCRPILGKHALAIWQEWNGAGLATVLAHESGAEIRAVVSVPQSETTWGKDGNPVERPLTLQKLGAALTYIRRYSIQAILGIAAEEDTDGDADGTQGVTARNGHKPPPREATVALPQANDTIAEVARLKAAREQLARDGATDKQLEAWRRDVGTAMKQKRIAAGDVDALKTFHASFSGEVAEPGAGG